MKNSVLDVCVDIVNYPYMVVLTMYYCDGCSIFSKVHIFRVRVSIFRGERSGLANNAEWYKIL